LQSQAEMVDSDHNGYVLTEFQQLIVI
jgi:hypothetical protein